MYKTFLYVLLALLLLPACMLAAVPVTDGLIIQLDASSLTSLNDGDTVTTWPDSATSDSVNGTMKQINSNGLPQFYNYMANGLPVVRFTNNQIMSTSGFTWPNVNNGVTIIGVMTGDLSEQTGERLCGIGHSTGSAGQTFAFDASTSVSGNDAGSGCRFNNGKMLKRSANPLDGDFHICALQIDQGMAYQTANYYVDSLTPIAYDNTANPGNTISFPISNNVFTIGTSWINGSIGWSDAYSGDIAEIMVYNRVLTGQDLEDVMVYLWYKYMYRLIDLSTNTVEVSEGDSITFTMALKEAPTSPVTMSLSELSLPTQATVSPETITYDSTNWSDPITIQVDTIDDDYYEGNHLGGILLQAQSADTKYDGMISRVQLLITDDECTADRYTAADINQDCVVNIEDIAYFAQAWLWCDPMKDINCDDLR